MSAKGPSVYEDFLLRSVDGEITADLKENVVLFQYYENISFPIHQK